MLYNIVRYLYKIDTNKLGLNYFQGGIEKLYPLCK